MLTDDFEGASLKGFLMLMSPPRPCEMTNRNKNNKTGFDNLGYTTIISTIRTYFENFPRFETGPSHLWSKSGATHLKYSQFFFKVESLLICQTHSKWQPFAFVKQAQPFKSDYCELHFFWNQCLECFKVLFHSSQVLLLVVTLEKTVWFFTSFFSSKGSLTFVAWPKLNGCHKFKQKTADWFLGAKESPHPSLVSSFAYSGCVWLSKVVSYCWRH